MPQKHRASHIRVHICFIRHKLDNCAIDWFPPKPRSECWCHTFCVIVNRASMLISLARVCQQKAALQQCRVFSLLQFDCFFHSVFRLVILLLLLSFHFHSIRIYVFIWQLLDFVALTKQKRVEKSGEKTFLSPKYYNPLDCSFSQLFCHHSLPFNNNVNEKKKTQFFSPSVKVINIIFSLSRLLWRKCTNRFMIVYRIWNFSIY